MCCFHVDKVGLLSSETRVQKLLLSNLLVMFAWVVVYHMLFKHMYKEPFGPRLSLERAFLFALFAQESVAYIILIIYIYI